MWKHTKEVFSLDRDKLEKIAKSRFQKLILACWLDSEKEGNIKLAGKSVDANLQVYCQPLAQEKMNP